MAAPFGVDIGGTNPAFWTFSVESEFDSWLSVGTDLSPAGAQAASPGLGLVRPTATLSRLNACCREPSSSHAMVWLLQDAWTSTAEFSTTDGAIFWMDPASGPAASGVSTTFLLDSVPLSGSVLLSSLHFNQIAFRLKVLFLRVQGALVMAQLTLPTATYTQGGTAVANLQGRSAGNAADYAGYRVTWAW